MRQNVPYQEVLQQKFQSTHPARGATIAARNFANAIMISIHAPREGCDGRTETETAHERQGAFQSTHPARGATRRRRAPREEEGISIHAPREGCDGRLWYTIDVVEGFQSTHPARGATISMYGHGGMWIFQSTHPARGATGWERIHRATGDISIHAPREGCDPLRRYDPQGER